jgi:hypothetical protein
MFSTRNTCDFCGKSYDQIQRDHFDVAVAQTMSRLCELMDRAVVVLEQIAHPMMLIQEGEVDQP